MVYPRVVLVTSQQGTPINELGSQNEKQTTPSQTFARHSKHRSFVAALAQQPVSKVAPSAERLRRDVTYLASDALEGRRTGTPGQTMLHYIAANSPRLV